MKEKTNFLAMMLCLCAGLCAASSGGNAGILQFFIFKGDAMLEMLALEWSESEAFLEYVLNAPAYPRRVRGSALFQLKKRFDWPATNTVPEL